ncbi:MAG: hypothetical protein M1832_001340 [Thelocarpon impressellum]|nr:MAG: hypothetical protein M1832_001340 [Thelocarpon impressellum]
MATTPPPASSIRTPPTPHHGPKHDSYQPYSTRRSMRSQRAAHTPPPPSSLDAADAHLSLTPPTAKRSATSRNAGHAFSPPPSIQSSPKKKVGRATASSRRGLSGRLTDDNTASAAAALGLSPTDPTTSVPTIVADSSTFTAAGMLPTPAKTPRKRPGQPAAGISSTARILFPSRPETVEEVMPSPKKKRARKHQAFTLASFNEGADGNGEDGGIAIFTDSKERVPELDLSEDNPFYEKPAKKSGTKTNGVSRRKAGRNDDVEEAINRDEGMVYVFRGKKIYRKFEDEEEEDAEEVDEADVGVAAASLRPLTRSSIKPRLLFPSASRKHRPEEREDDVADEEAITDIDDAANHPLPSSDIEGGSDAEEQVGLPGQAHRPTTPSGDAMATSPTSPPSTIRATRASARRAAPSSSPLGAPEPVEYAPVSRKGGKKSSPFAGWPRTKAGSRKRAGEATDEGGRKRTRSDGYPA